VTVEFLSSSGFGTITVTEQALVGDGSASAPSYTYTSAPGTGDYLATDDIYTAVDDVARLRRGLSGVILRPELPLAWTAGAVDGTPDVAAYRDGVGILSRRVGTAAQEDRLYNTWTDVDNGEWLELKWSGNVALLRTQKNGSGSTRALELGVGGTSYWQIDTSGNLKAKTDGQVDFGGSGALRPRDAYLSRNLTVGNNITAACNVYLTAGTLQQAKGANVTAASTITLGMDGSFYDITGGTNINHMTTTGFQIGSVVSLRFNGAVNVNHNTASPPAGTAPFYNSSAANFAATANDILHVIYDGTYWHHFNRAVV
jgi:hypothetical protein